MRHSTAAAAAVVSAFAFTATAGAQGPKLFGTVGPGFDISLRDAKGNAVTQVDPGPMDLQVDDLSELHNFRLTGPGVDVATAVAGTGRQTFQLTLTEGIYRFQCDPHSNDMQGSLTVGNPPPPPPPPPPGPPPAAGPKPSAPVGAKLVLIAGPGFSISLVTASGRPVKLLRAGGYTILVRDRSATHNVHVLGAGVNRRTSVAARVTRTWKVVLTRGTLRFQCDPHRRNLRGTVRVG